MRYLNKLDGVKAFDLGQKFVRLMEGELICVDEIELSFPESSTFYQIDEKVFSVKDYYIDEGGHVVTPDYLKGLFLGDVYSGGIKKYTSGDNKTYLFRNDDKTPLVTIDRDEISGSVVTADSCYYVVMRSTELLINPVDGELGSVTLPFKNYISGVPVLFESKAILFEGLVFIYLHDQSWNDYGFRVFKVSSEECVFSSNSFGPNFFIHQSKIYSISRNTQVIQVMNKDAFDVEKLDLSNELGDFVFETQCSPCFYDKELFVALKKKGEDVYSHWGMIDLDTFKLKYQTEMLRDFSKKPTKNNKTFVSEIKANGKMVGVKVSGNILHIFERE